LTPARAASLLRDYERKRARAAHHFHALRKSIEEFAKLEREPVAGRFEAPASQYVFDVPLEPVNPEWPLLVGDFIYDTRASLDYLLTALIRSTGNEETETSNFPIFSIKRIEEWQYAEERWDRDESGRIARSLKGTPPGTKEALKPLQPFHEVPRSNPWGHPLFALQTLNNRDKHRRLNLLGRQADISFITASGQSLFHGQPSSLRIADAEERGGFTARLTVDDQFDADVLLASTYDVRLHEPPWLVGNLIETLTEINRFIEVRVLPTVSTLL
jgi:hypothetical protein